MTRTPAVALTEVFEPMKNGLYRLVLVAALILELSANAVIQASIVRLQVVNVPVDNGLLGELLPDFERMTVLPSDTLKHFHGNAENHGCARSP
jgi:hypothetical protein